MEKTRSSIGPGGSAEALHSKARSETGGGETRRVRRAVPIVIGIFVLTRVMAVIVAYAAPQHRDRPQFDWWSDNPLMRWDAGHYLTILTRGYSKTINDTTAFFPLYPIVARPVWWALEWMRGERRSGAGAGIENAEWALVIVSHAASLGAVLIFFSWCRSLAGDAGAVRAAALLCAFPTAMYFSVGYADGLFLLCVALMLWFVHRDRVWLAALACAAATAARPTGIVASGVLMLLAWPRDESTGRRGGFVGWAAIGVVSISGLLAHATYLWTYYGRPDAYFAAQKTWEIANSSERSWFKLLTLQPVLEPAVKPIKYALRGEWGKLADGRNWNRLINVLMLSVAVVGLRRPGPIPRPALLLTILVFLMAYLDDPFTGGRMLGIARYHLIGLPCFLWLALRPCWERWRATFGALVAVLLVLQCVYMAGYVDWILVS